MPSIKIHREGRRIIFTFLSIALAVNIALLMIFPEWVIIRWTIALGSIVFLAFTLYFFRNPLRSIVEGDSEILAPADGKVVVIEEVEEGEYFNDKRLQVSIFMSPANVHVNRNPISGEIRYSKHHHGKYLVAWHPKSSSENERNCTVIGNNEIEILVTQIAGKVARRIVSYVNEGDQVRQGSEFGFIKFGSRVDLFLPLDTELNVKINEKVRGGITVIGKLA